MTQKNPLTVRADDLKARSGMIAQAPILSRMNLATEAMLVAVDLVGDIARQLEGLPPRDENDEARA